MNKTINNLLISRPWIAHIDDERSEGNSIIVTLARGWYFADEQDCGVRGFDTVSEVKRDTTRKSVVQQTGAWIKGTEDDDEEYEYIPSAAELS